MASKPTSLIAKIAAALLAVGVAGVIFAPKNDAAVKNTQTPEQIASKKAEDKRFSIAFESGKTLKEAMRDPSSFVAEYAGVDDAGTIVCISYRAKNGFGGMNRESVVFANNTGSKNTADWKKYCTGKPLLDYLAAVN